MFGTNPFAPAMQNRSSDTSKNRTKSRSARRWSVSRYAVTAFATSPASACPPDSWSGTSA